MAGQSLSLSLSLYVVSPFNLFLYFSFSLSLTPSILLASFRHSYYDRVTSLPYSPLSVTTSVTRFAYFSKQNCKQKLPKHFETFRTLEIGTAL